MGEGERKRESPSPQETEPVSGISQAESLVRDNASPQVPTSAVK